MLTLRSLSRHGSCRWVWRLGPQRSMFSASATSSVTIPIVNCVDETTSLSDMIRPYYESQTPVLLRGAVAKAQAMQRWTNWNYLEQVVGPDSICQVEVGGTYAKSPSSDIRFGDYMAYLRFFDEKYGQSGTNGWPPSEELVYLAQNEIWHELLDDFDIPEYCSTPSVGEGKQYHTMIWIGPYGCVSPLHCDPLDNALMQFVGSKRVLLYRPEEYVYAGTEGNQVNTSPLDPESPFDLKKYPRSATLSPALEGTLHPGDMLHIPKKWWHHVRTLETSISVNSWWR